MSISRWACRMHAKVRWHFGEQVFCGEGAEAGAARVGGVGRLWVAGVAMSAPITNSTFNYDRDMRHATHLTKKALLCISQ